LNGDVCGRAVHEKSSGGTARVDDERSDKRPCIDSEIRESHGGTSYRESCTTAQSSEVSPFHAAHVLPGQASTLDAWDFRSLQQYALYESLARYFLEALQSDGHRHIPSTPFPLRQGLP